MGLYGPVSGSCRAQQALGTAIFQVDERVVGAPAKRYPSGGSGMGCSSAEFTIIECGRNHHIAGIEIEKIGNQGCTSLKVIAFVCVHGCIEFGPLCGVFAAASRMQRSNHGRSLAYDRKRARVVRD